MTPGGELELLFSDGARSLLCEVVLAGGPSGGSTRVRPDAGFLEWLAEDRTRVFALDAAASVRFMRAANALRYVRGNPTAPAAQGTR